MRNLKINIEVNFTTLDPSLAQQIWQAMQEGQVFALVGKKTVSIFDIKNMASVFLGHSRLGSRAVQHYNTIEDFQNGISLALLSQKTFVPANRIIDYCGYQQIEIPKYLLTEK